MTAILADSRPSVEPPHAAPGVHQRPHPVGFRRTIRGDARADVDLVESRGAEARQIARGDRTARENHDPTRGKMLDAARI